MNLIGRSLGHRAFQNSRSNFILFINLLRVLGVAIRVGVKVKVFLWYESILTCPI